MQPSHKKEQAIKARARINVLPRLASTFSTTKASFIRDITYPSEKDIGGPRVQVRMPTLRREGGLSQIPEDGDLAEPKGAWSPWQRANVRDQPDKGPKCWGCEGSSDKHLGGGAGRGQLQSLHAGCKGIIGRETFPMDAKETTRSKSLDDRFLADDYLTKTNRLADASNDTL